MLYWVSSIIPKRKVKYFVFYAKVALLFKNESWQFYGMLKFKHLAINRRGTVRILAGGNSRMLLLTFLKKKSQESLLNLRRVSEDELRDLVNLERSLQKALK